MPVRDPLRIFDPAADGRRLFAMRVSGDRSGNYIARVDAVGDNPAFVRLRAPSAATPFPSLHAVSLPIKARVRERAVTAENATTIRVVLRGTAQSLRLSLVEADGTTWSTLLSLSSTWTTHEIPLQDFHLSPGLKLPLGYPGNWNYALPPAVGRGGAGDRLQTEEIEHIQFVVTPVADFTTELSAEISAAELRCSDADAESVRPSPGAR